MLIARFCFQVAALVFDKFPLGNDVIGPQFLRPPEAVFGDIGLGFPDQVFLHQLI